MRIPAHIALCFYILGLLGCSYGPDEYLFQGGTMGTSWSVKLVSSEFVDQPEIQLGVQSVLNEINSEMSNWDAGSDVSVFNSSAAGCSTISEQTAAVIQVSQELSQLTDGMFDATVGPLVELWGFGVEFSAEQMPKANEIAEALDRVGYQKLSLGGTELCKETDDLFLNLSAVAKGYGVDQVANYLELKSFDRYLVEVGGEVRSLGVNRNGEPWRIGIEMPLDNVISGRVQEVVELEDQALATSGDYRNYFIHDGVRYSHIIDPLTGYPVPQELASVTVLNQSAAWADGWATALLALGPEAGLLLAEQQNIAAYFVLRTDSNFAVTTSSAW